MIALETKSLSVYYKAYQILFDLSVKIQEKRITAIIGPGGSGKTTLLRIFNRLVEVNPDIHFDGIALFNGKNIYGSDVNATDIRRKIGMVFQKPIPFPGSVRENLVWASNVNGLHYDTDELCERSLRAVHLWKELKDKQSRNALELSAGQQQRLCIARALSINPEVLLLDEPTSTLDPIASGKIEDLMCGIKDFCTVVLVTNNLQQAGRISDDTLFLFNGIFVENGDTKTMYYNPQDPRTENFLSGRIGSDLNRIENRISLATLRGELHAADDHDR